MRESRRERTLLRLIENQQKTITDLNDRLMALSGHTWPPTVENFPPFEEEEDDGGYVSSLHGLPPD